MGGILFVTGTDTGAGKTLLAASILACLRARGERAWAVKPFCCGSRHDAKLFFELQDRELALDVVNPVYLQDPIAPYVFFQRSGTDMPKNRIVEYLRQLQRRCDWLIVEGCGGLLVPLGIGYSIADLLLAFDSSVIVAARNKLGVINHALLTMTALASIGVCPLGFVLMETGRNDLASRTNQASLKQLLSPAKVWRLPWLGQRASHLKSVTKNFRKVKKALAPMLEIDRLSAVKRH
jgi:dethiobiotin synthetase